MTSAVITTPDGRRARVSGPDKESVQRQIAAMTVTPAAPAAPASLDLVRPWKDTLTGVRAASRNIGKNLGIPGTDIDVNALLELLGAQPIEDIRAEYEQAGPAAGISKFVTDVGATAPLGAQRALGTFAAKALPGSPRAAANVARTLGAGIEGGVSSALTGEGALPEKLLYGAAGGVIGDRALRAMARPITGFSNIHPEAKTLLEAGVPVTIGRSRPDTLAGRMLRAAEDRATSIPVIGDIMVSGHKAGMNALKKKFVEAGMPKGMQLPQTASTQPLKALEEVGEEFSRRYKSILEGPGTTPVEPAFKPSAPLSEPAFRPGYKILYRGSDPGKEGGRWYSADRKYAERFGPVTAIEVPYDIARKAEAIARSRGTQGHYYLPADYKITSSFPLGSAREVPGLLRVEGGEPKIRADSLADYAISQAGAEGRKTPTFDRLIGEIRRKTSGPQAPVPDEVIRLGEKIKAANEKIDSAVNLKEARKFEKEKEAAISDILGIFRKGPEVSYSDAIVGAALKDPSAPLPKNTIEFIEKRIRKALDIENPTPQSLFDAQSVLRAEARDISKSPLATRVDRGESKAYRKAADEILSILESEHPGLKELSGPYKNYVTLRHEVEKGLGFGENLTIKQMQTSAEKSGNKKLLKLTRAAGSVLPSRIPDSGTAQRSAGMLLGGGGAVYMLDPSLMTAGAMALGLAAPGVLARSQAGSKYLLGQYPHQQALARALEKYSASTGGILSNNQFSK